MNTNRLFQLSTGPIALSLFLLFSPQTVAEAGTNPYSSTQTVVLEDGTSLDIIIANSPATSPINIMASMEYSITPLASAPGDVVIPDVPAFDGLYGSSATAGAMITGYYDRTGYPNMYTGPTDGGVMPLTNISWGLNLGLCPLSATKNGLDGRAINGHIDDYFVATGNDGPDPYVVNGWTEHTIGDCTGDYMKTSKWFPGSASNPLFSEDVNKDGAAVFILDSAGYPMEADTLESNGYHQYDAGYGLKLFFESRDYTVSTMYNQYINPVKIYGFSYDQYKAEINAGRPVLLHLSGHSVVGTGYNDTNGEGIIFHDSWSHVEQTMTWGGMYNTIFEHTSVTIVTLEDIVEPGFSWLLFLPAIIGSN